MVIKFVTTFLNYLGMRLIHYGHLLVPKLYYLASFPGHMGWEGRGYQTVTRVKRTEVKILLASLQEIVGHGW